MWQVQNLDLAELTRSMTEWAGELPDNQRRPLLLKLSTATAMSGGLPGEAPDQDGPGPVPHELCGPWASEYTYYSTGRRQEFTGAHAVDLELRQGKLWGRSRSTQLGTIELDLRVNGQLVVGSWTERTAPDGYYRGAVYHGTVMLVLDPTGRSMRGRWLGPEPRLRRGLGHLDSHPIP